MARECALEKVFGESSVVKILDVMMNHPTMDYSKLDLAEAAGVAESTVHRNWETIEELDAVEVSRAYGRAKLYRLNTDSEAVELLYRLDQAVRT